MADKVSEITMGLISCTPQKGSYIISPCGPPRHHTIPSSPISLTAKKNFQYYVDDYSEVGFEVDEGTRLHTAYNLERV